MRIVFLNNQDSTVSVIENNVVVAKFEFSGFINEEVMNELLYADFSTIVENHTVEEDPLAEYGPDISHGLS